MPSPKRGELERYRVGSFRGPSQPRQAYCEIDLLPNLRRLPARESIYIVVHVCKGYWALSGESVTREQRKMHVCQRLWRHAQCPDVLESIMTTTTAMLRVEDSIHFAIALRLNAQ